MFTTTVEGMDKLTTARLDEDEARERAVNAWVQAADHQVRGGIDDAEGCAEDAASSPPTGCRRDATWVVHAVRRDQSPLRHRSRTGHGMMDRVSPSHREVVGAFVVRARRIQAHSLVRDLTVLSDLAQERFDVHLRPDGTSRIRHRLPPDEEVFESLAARVRPLLLVKESVHHSKVIKALKRLLDTTPTADVEQYRDELSELREAWKTTTSGETYGLVQWRGTEVPDTLTPVSNVLLAEAWMYIDLVHVDPDQRRRDALNYPMRQRYLAAVRYYCRIAELVVRTLRYVEKLRDAGVVVLDAADWEREVVVGSEIVEEGIIRVAPAGTGATTADFGEQPGEAWHDLTAVEALRQG